MNQTLANTIVGAINARKGRQALFLTTTGFRLRNQMKMRICDLSDPNLLGFYSQDVKAEQIMGDWAKKVA